MKVRSVVMHARALPTRLPHLQRKHAVLLVAGVLLLHLWLLAGAPLWLTPESGKPLRTQALVTRQIEVAAPRAPQVPKPVQPTPAKPSPAQTEEAPAEASAATPPLKFDDLGQDLSAPVGLPARSAASVDLPPYKRAGSEGLTDVTAFKAPDSALLKYQVQGQAKGFSYWASAELQWLQDGKDYEARLEVSAFLLGSRVQISKGTLGAEGLMPTRFGDKTRSEQAAHFQRDKGLITFSANSPDAPLLKGAQDRLSVVLQLSSLLAADPTRFPAGTMLSFQTVSQREAEVWQFLVEKEEMLQLPFGDISAIKLNRKPRREFDQHIELWFAPTLGYLPVRLRITNANGDFVDQLLSKAEKPSP
ncbi:DUF3108 domain-containing protein [Limnohabitans sp. Rim8]|jgi:hypothetical protein|uniref:DUF3108 domain-containing protein n=1 Tax=Limnohabitans sp. Rim8 TaxID=1100718 RepID=UPI001E4536B4|nr:DUF3108 domain-containing protein [Limnohabitans sp. Rim8]